MTERTAPAAPTPTPLSSTPRSSLRRKKERAGTDRAELHAILDAALVCHLGLVLDGHPVVLPTGIGRDAETLYLHGSSGARSLLAAEAEPEACVTVTLLDEIIYARSLQHHSMNYRSAVIHGRLRAVTDPDEKLHGLRVLTEHLAPGSWEHAREPSAKELAGVSVVAMPLDEASVKSRSGPPGDDPADVEAAAAWAGRLPLRQQWGEPIPAPDLPDGTTTPAHVARRAAR